MLCSKRNPINLIAITTTKLDFSLLLSADHLKQFSRLCDVAADLSAFHGAYDADGSVPVMVVATIYTRQEDRENDVVLLGAFCCNQQDRHGEDSATVTGDFFALSRRIMSALTAVHACMQIHQYGGVLEGYL